MSEGINFFLVHGNETPEESDVLKATIEMCPVLQHINVTLLNQASVIPRTNSGSWCYRKEWGLFSGFFGWWF